MATSGKNFPSETSKNIVETYFEISKQAETLLDAEYSTIFLEQNGELKRVYSSNLTLALSDLRKNGRTYKAFQNGKIHFTSVKSVKDINPLQLKLNVKTIVFIPLIWKRKKIGMLNVLSRKEPRFSEKELYLVNVLGSLASLSIRNAQLLDENNHLLAVREIFFAAASHELKTPLTTIKLYGQLLQSALNKNQLPKPEWGNILVTEISRVTRLVNEFWLTDQIRSGHLVYSRKQFALIDLINEAKMEFSAKYSQKVVVKNTLEGARIYADFDRMLGVLTNILNNAGKYSPENSKIAISLKSKDPYIVIQVKDQGCGIPPEELDKIFDAFYKGGQKEGIGIGLYLAKQIVEGHNGIIKISSKVDIGTRVRISLPAINQDYEHTSGTTA